MLLVCETFCTGFSSFLFLKKKKKERLVENCSSLSIEVQLSAFIRFGYSIMVVNIVTVSRNSLSDSSQKVFSRSRFYLLPRSFMVIPVC